MSLRALAFAALALAACAGRESGASPEAKALAEFRGAYPDGVASTGVVRTYDLVAEPVEIDLVDGRKLKVWAYNGQVPGPTLRVRLGETLRVRFTNRLPQETTIHWHGVRVPNAMDGVPHLTQPPVPTEGTFVYEFTPKDAGTFWYHPHVRASEQVERGLYGPLIVEDAEPPAYTADEVLFLDDWRLDESGQIDPEFNTRHDLAMDGRWGGAITVNGRSNATLRVAAGGRVRLRLLNAANGRVFRPDFGDLDATVIAVDGMYLREPVPAVGFELAPGNRLDVDLAFNRSTGALELWDRFIERRPSRLVTFEVGGSAVDTPTFPSPARARVPVWGDALSVAPVHSFRLNVERGGPFGLAWTIDGVAFAGHDHAAGHGAEGTPALTLTRGRFYRVRFVNESPRIHPIHLHGMFFRLLARNGAPVDEPFFRDTVLVRGREEIDVGVVPTDPGLWMMHCHILEHAEAGMMTTIRVRD